jgi:YfiH family protein
MSGRAAGDQRFSPDPSKPRETGGGQGTIHGPVRDAFFHSLGTAPDRVYSLCQVHSRDVFTLGDPGDQGAALLPPAAFVREGDGMVSFSRLPVLAVTTADCLPVFLLDMHRGFFAALHSGWKGTGIVLRALTLMGEAGTRPEHVAAVLGPSIRNCCYRVDEERALAFEAEFGGGSKLIPPDAPYPLGPVIRRDASGGVFLDLQAANVRLLAAAGVKHIAHCEDCTFTDERLGSFRRQGPAAYTRMTALAGFFSPPMLQW